jgi:hypothetical protein
VRDEFAAALGEDRRTAGETCALPWAAVSVRTPELGPVRQRAEDDHSAVPAGRVVNRERRRIERSEVIQRGQAPSERWVGSGKQIKKVHRLAKMSRDATQGKPWWPSLEWKGSQVYAPGRRGRSNRRFPSRLTYPIFPPQRNAIYYSCLAWGIASRILI